MVTLFLVANVRGSMLWPGYRSNAGCYCHPTDPLLIAALEALPELRDGCKQLQPSVKTTTMVKASKEKKVGGEVELSWLLETRSSVSFHTV